MEDLMEGLAKDILYWENERIRNRNEKIELLKKLAVNEAKQNLFDDFVTGLKQTRGDI